MPIAPGQEIYDADSAPIVARGVAISEDELGAALQTEIAGILRDDEGKEQLEDLLANLAETTFETEGLRAVLDIRPAIPSWRVGEALAEAFLIDHRECEFPWPSGRDLKNPNASPAGTDLVGFQQTGGDLDHRFAFGEVKTSSDQHSPPSVVSGRHGLVAQVEALRDSEFTKDCLVRYLAFHARERPWEVHFQTATKRYLGNKADVSLFGILVRDVAPNRDDLASRAVRLATNCPPLTTVELRAIYLPLKVIDPDPPRVPLGERAMRACGL